MNMDINIIFSLVIIFVIIHLILVNQFDQTNLNERFDSQETVLQPQLDEAVSVNTISLTTPLVDISTNKKTVYGNFISSSVPSCINEFVYIDETNIEYLKDKVINISKPVKINVTDIPTSVFPVNLFFYNSTKSSLNITLMFTDIYETTYTEIECESNHMTNDINKIKLGINNSGALKNIVTTKKNFLENNKIPVFYRNNTWMSCKK